MIQVDLQNIRSFIPLPYEAALAPRLRIAHDHLQKGDGAGGDFTGWVRLPEDYDRAELGRIKEAARRIQADSQALVVIGIGGSYLGARGVIECLCSPNYNLKKKSTPNIYFIGNGLSADALAEVMELVDGVDFSVNVISKSGTTTEPAVAFRFFRELLEKKYGPEEASRRIYATTDAHKGALKSLADEKGYEEFVVPDNVGGRYSVLTAVGLLPIAVAGIDVDALLRGAQDMMHTCALADMNENPAWQYAAARYEIYRTGKKIELLAAYEPCFRFMSEWWKQLYGESEGKDNKGIFPASVIFSTDLHSLGQYIQEGERVLFETVLDFKNTGCELEIPYDEANVDGLNFLAGKKLNYVNSTAMLGTLFAHNDGGVPNIVLEVSDRTAYSFGYLVYFFELACAVSGYTLGVNPFNQPGVEAYKKNMFALLGKAGYETEKEALEARMQ